MGLERQRNLGGRDRPRRRFHCGAPSRVARARDRYGTEQPWPELRTFVYGGGALTPAQRDALIGLRLYETYFATEAANEL